MESYKKIKVFTPASRQEWRQWLEQHHESSTKVWLRLFKKQSGIPSITYDQALDEALCFGWIDSVANSLDENSFLQYFAKRNPRSKWSRVNKEKVKRLEEQGLMTDAGRAAIQLAKDTGTWQALDEVENLTVPPDLQELLEMNPEALQYFNAFPRSVRRAILEWIQAAKKPETRMKRIHHTAEMAAQNKRANHKN
jgi:uncharacterized protein YdeI (YjbR/CyaY-like superfamily)